MIGACLMGLAGAMLLLGELARRREAPWLTRSDAFEAGYAAVAGLCAAGGLFMMLPPPG